MPDGATNVISFKTTKGDALLIGQIVKRALETAPTLDAMTLNMDLTACHANGCEMDFGALLRADDFNFWHDVAGIRRHIDRKTGKLTDCFVPRFAFQQEPAGAGAIPSDMDGDGFTPRHADNG